MKRTVTMTVGGLAVAGLLAAMIATTEAAHASSNNAAGTIVGSWRMSIDPLPNPGGDPPPFPSRVAFSRGGVLVGTASKFPPGFTSGSADVGAWSQDGDTARFQFERFLYNANGFAGIQRVTATATVSADGETLAGPATATVLATDGTTVVASFQVAASGTRMAP